MPLKVSPALVLFFLAPAIAELLSGSAPPTEFFNLVSFVLLVALYGSGALIVRELKVRWSKGYVSLFVLGAAYGMIEEGLMVKSFFDPGWMDLGVLGVYGRWLEINWVWSEWLTVYHALFSIAIPITLVELAFSERRNESWLGNRKLGGLTALLAGVVLFGFFFLTGYQPPLPQYFCAVAITVFLVFLAWKIPPSAGRKGNKKVPGPAWLAVFGFVSALAFFLFYGAGPHLISQPAVLMVLGVVLVFALFSIVKRYNWGESTAYQKFALASGALGFLVLLAPLQELDKSRPDNPQGMIIVGLVALLLLILLGRRLRTRKLGEMAKP